MICCFPVRFRRFLSILVSLACFAGAGAPAWAQFETRASRSLPGGAFSLAVGDFNGDGKLDVAVTGDSLLIMLGNGDGTFQPPASYPGLYYSIAVADFNNDGIPDLVVAPDNNSVIVYLGNGDGTFQPPKTSFTTNGCASIAVGDFNGDGKMDLAVVDHPYVSVLLGNGDGTFQPPIDNDSFVEPQGLVPGDFNNDHLLDVAVIGSFGGSANLGVLLGNGNGTLQPALTYPLEHPPGTISAADFNSDGKLDVAIGGYIFDGVTVFLGNGDGSFDAGQTYLGGSNAVLIADFNGDGKLDMVADPTVYGAAEFLGNGDGTFQPAVIYAANDEVPAAVGDLNGDRKPDLLLFLEFGDSVTTMLNTGALDFSPSTPLTFPVQLVGTVSSAGTVQLTNRSKHSVSVQSVKTSGPFTAGGTCDGDIAEGAACEISVSFTPSNSGKQLGGVTLVDSASSKPQFIELSGVGTAIETSPTALKFGTQKVGTKSAPQVLTVSNRGGHSITITGISVGGTDGSDFPETNNCAGQSLEPNSACQVSVTFNPKGTGRRSATMSLKAKGTPSPRPVTFTGTGD